MDKVANRHTDTREGEVWPACFDVRDRGGRYVGRLRIDLSPNARVVVAWLGCAGRPVEEIRLPVQTWTCVDRRVLASGYDSICWFERDFVEHHEALDASPAYESAGPQQDDPLLLEMLAWRRITLPRHVIVNPDRIGP